MSITKADQLRHVTLSLIRKRSEHNELMVSNLEEIALHQEELEAIGPILGRTCGKTLKIHLLQNNVISQMTDLKMMKSLEYLNLALNNIKRVEGLENCENLNKLDLTLNFVGVADLEFSVNNMKKCLNLRELYMMGNPCCPPNPSKEDDAAVGAQHTKETKSRGWEGYRMFVIASLPQIQSLDGKEILRSERIRSMQQLPSLSPVLRELAAAELQTNESQGKTKIYDDEDMTEHTPEVRAQISREISQQKSEKEKNERMNMPKPRGEKEFEEEQNDAIKKARDREERGDIKQCNQGGWKYQFDEEKKPGYLLLDIATQKHLSTSLIDVDVHPTYISIVIKSKILRLVLPAEVKSGESTAQRSTTTGHLLVSMPKVDPHENQLAPSIRNKSTMDNTKKKVQCAKSSLSSDLLKDAMTTNKARNGKCISNIGLNEIHCKKKNMNNNDSIHKQNDRKILNPSRDCENDDDEPPPLF